ncbi:MAG: hypothetical protein ACI9XU_000959 [Arenicella sp.]|jgi:hypothetical protein
MKYDRTESNSFFMSSNSKAIIYMMAFLLCGSFAALAQESIGAKQAIDETAVEGARNSSLEKSHKVYFSLADEFNGPKAEAKRSFDCSDQIYAVAELSNYPKGEYQLSVVWKDPNDSVREKTSYPFNVHNAQTRIWAWLTLSRATGAGLIQWIDPAAGLESFIGIWTIEVLINGKRISKQTIDVSC